MTIEQDEKLKAACHGLFLGCLLPVLMYNLAAWRKRNILVYSAVAVYEVMNIIEHLRSEAPYKDTARCVRCGKLTQ